MALRLAVDIGGTFTDATLVGSPSGERHVGKVRTTPHDLSECFFAAVAQIEAAAGIEAADLAQVVHATTVATNAVIERKLAPAAFLATEGFSDMLEIARQIRPSLYDLRFQKPEPLVPRELTFAVPERLDAAGEVLRPLDEDAVRAIATELREQGVEAVAVCLLHSYVNPAHERLVAKIIAQEHPRARVSLSSDVVPEFREYFRASTTVINAVVQPVVSAYLGEIETGLRHGGVDAPVLVMQSSGAVMTVEAAKERPVFMLESGPAAGAVAAAHLAGFLGREHVISFDMGGTTTKTCLIEDGRPAVARGYQVGARTGRGLGAFGGAAGYPVRTAVVDLIEIGAGGGSVAWVDSGGALRVGPRSAGADPGPVCYGAGGSEPTITDANLVLGRLSPDRFLGGRVPLDLPAAARAINDACARPLGLSVDEAALGIVEVADAAMVQALQLVTVQRGKSYEDQVLVAFGGAGPLHATGLAADFPCDAVVVPPDPGTFSTIGLLATDLRRELTSTVLELLDDLGTADIEERFEAMERSARASLSGDGVASDDQELRRSADLRYFGQSFEITVDVPPGPPQGGLAGVDEAFHREHERAYGFAVAGEPIEVVSVRVAGIGRIDKPAPTPLLASPEKGGPTEIERRPVRFTRDGDRITTAILDRSALGAGHELAGPAIVEEANSTTVVPPGWSGRIDDLGNIWLRLTARSSPTTRGDEARPRM